MLFTEDEIVKLFVEIDDFCKVSEEDKKSS
jgi:hypothetical protein